MTSILDLPDFSEDIQTSSRTPDVSYVPPSVMETIVDKIGTTFGLDGDKARALGSTILGSGLGALLDGKSGALTGGSLGAMLGGGGKQIGSLMSKDPTTSRLIGDSILGAMAGNQIKGIGGQGGATVAAMLSALAGGKSGEMSDDLTLKELMRKYWPVLALTGAGMYRGYQDRQNIAHASLPTIANSAPRASLSDIPVGEPNSYEGDYFTYGERPAHRFYGKADGGSVAGMGAMPVLASEMGAISGPGSGRSDSIPARLSDGEYVFDAETTALLGDGSTSAGAAKLDQLRERIRMKKGKALAKGKISPDAGDVEDYMGDL